MLLAYVHLPIFSMFLSSFSLSCSCAYLFFRYFSHSSASIFLIVRVLHMSEIDCEITSFTCVFDKEQHITDFYMCSIYNTYDCKFKQNQPIQIRMMQIFSKLLFIRAVWDDEEVIILYENHNRCYLSIYVIGRWLITLDKTHVQHSVLARFKLDYTARQIHLKLCKSWGEGYSFYSTVVEWIQRFRQERLH